MISWCCLFRYLYFVLAYFCNISIWNTNILCVSVSTFGSSFSVTNGGAAIFPIYYIFHPKAHVGLYVFHSVDVNKHHLFWGHPLSKFVNWACVHMCAHVCACVFDLQKIAGPPTPHSLSPLAVLLLCLSSSALSIRQIAVSDTSIGADYLLGNQCCLLPVSLNLRPPRKPPSFAFMIWK